MLEHFVFAYREDIIRRCKKKLASRSAPTPTAAEMKQGVPLCLDDVIDALRLRLSAQSSVPWNADAHRHDRLRHDFTASQVVHDYGDVCQAITEVVTEKRAPISADEFRILNRYLDEAIASVIGDDTPPDK